MRVVPWLLCLVLVCPTMGLSQPNLPDPDAPGLDGGERLATLIARADLERQRHGTSRARFERIEKGPLVLEPEISRGIFSYGEGGRSRWDFESPEAMTVWVGDEAIVTWFRDQGRAERLSLGDYGVRFFALFGAGGSLAELENRFEIRATFPHNPEEPYRLDLIPRSRRLARRLAALGLVLDRRLFVPREVSLRGTDGGQTTVRFDQLEPGFLFEEGHFEPRVDPSVEVVEIAGPGGASRGERPR